MLSTAALAMGTTMTVEEISPHLAQEYLGAAPMNRRTRRGKIEQYARDMTSGRWHSSVIRFDQDGNLVDGQHRLWAVIVADQPQLFYVERGLPPEAIRTIDQGMSRTAGDVLSIAGENNAITLASAIRYARWFERNPGIAPSGQSRSPYSPDEIVEYLDANPGLRDAVRTSKAMQRNLPAYGSSSVAAALRYLEGRIDPDLAEEFWTQVETGVEMAARTGPYVLRELVINDRLKPQGERIGLNELAALSIKAWNFWQYGREVRQLRWLRGTQLTEAFPVIGARPSA